MTWNTGSPPGRHTTVDLSPPNPPQPICRRRTHRNRFVAAEPTTTVTRVCLLGSEDVDVQYALLSREPAREALSTYERPAPFENSLAVDTVSLGAAVSLCNDLNWYLVRFVELALVREPSVSTEEWLSRSLAAAIRDGTVDPDGTGDRLAVYGVADGRVVEPMYVTRRPDGTVPDYDLRDLPETVTVRVTDAEFDAG